MAFLVITSREVFDVPVAPELADLEDRGVLAPQSFGLDPHQLELVVIAPRCDTDIVGVVTTPEGMALGQGDIASRLGVFGDITALEADPATIDAELIDTLPAERVAQQHPGLPGVPGGLRVSYAQVSVKINTTRARAREV